MWPYTKNEADWTNEPVFQDVDLSPEAIAAHTAEAHRLRSEVIRKQFQNLARGVVALFRTANSAMHGLTDARTHVWNRNRTSTST